MKRILATLLLCLTPFYATACAKENLPPPTVTTAPPTTEAVATVTPVEKPVEPKLASPTPLSVLDEIPIATAEMSSDELRQICVDFMRLQSTFPWQPAKTVTYTVNERTNSIKSSTVYSGMPYITNTTSGLYQMLRYYDEETGLVDTEAMGSQAKNTLGNQCSGSTFWAWSRVSNAISWGSTSRMTPAYGAVLIGPYTHNVSSYTDTATSTICQQNGEQIMYQSYAELKPGDGIVYSSGGYGHVEMAVMSAVVVYAEDGTIDGQKSYCRFQDHRGTHSLVVGKDGTFSEKQYVAYNKYSFARLLGLGNLPFSIPEFHGQDPVEKGECVLDVAEEPLSLSRLMKGTIRANYAIAEVTVSFYDACGTKVGERFFCITNGYKKSVSTSLLGPAALLEKEAENAVSATVQVRIATGERITVYSGAMTR